MPSSNRDLPPPPPSNNKGPAKASHSGRKTSASAATFAAAAVAVPLDPTGIALITAVGSGAAALSGFAYHSGHKAVTKYRAKKAASQASSSETLVLSNPQADTILTLGTVDLQTELESCIRRLSCSITGVVVTGPISFILPSFLLGVALNGAEFIWQARRLHKLTAIAETNGGVDRYLSSPDITMQVMSGILIKSAILLCTLGTDVNIVIEGFAQLLVSAEVVVDPALIPDTWQQAGHVSELYSGLTGQGFLHSTGQIAGEPANFTAGLLGYQQTPTWGSGASEGNVMAIGAANVLVDLVAGKLVENPTRELLDTASRLGRRFGWRGRAN